MTDIISFHNDQRDVQLPYDGTTSRRKLWIVDNARRKKASTSQYVYNLTPFYSVLLLQKNKINFTESNQIKSKLFLLTWNQKLTI